MHQNGLEKPFFSDKTRIFKNKINNEKQFGMIMASNIVLIVIHTKSKILHENDELEGQHQQLRLKSKL